MRIIIERPETDKTPFKELILEPHSKLIAKSINKEQTWYCSNSTRNLLGGGVFNLPDLSHHELLKDQQFNIQMAVAAGNIYRLLLGEPQPKFYSGIDQKNEHYRLSQAVPNYIDWADCIEMEDGDSDEQDLELHYTLLGNTLIKGTNTVETPDGQSREIKKIVSSAIVSFFLCDIDTNPGNFGLVEYENNYHMIKIDPECCFNEAFFTQGAEAIYEGLDDITHHHSNDFFDNFTDNFPGDDQTLDGFMNTDKAHLEKLAIIYRIINQPIEDYELILKSCIDENYHDKIKILLNGLKHRLDLFSQGAQRLKGFKEYSEMHQDTIQQAAAIPADNLVTTDTVSREKKRTKTTHTSFFNLHTMTGLNNPILSDKAPPLQESSTSFEQAILKI